MFEPKEGCTASSVIYRCYWNIVWFRVFCGNVLLHCRSRSNAQYYVSLRSALKCNTSNATRFPIYVLWREATSSAAAATTFLVALFIILLFVINAMQQTSSHLIWAFGRDNAVIFSAQLSRIHPTLEVPVWGLLANAGCVLITGCLYLASSAAFNALINSSIVLQMVSFSIPCAMLLAQKRNENVLPSTRQFKVPAWLGWAANLTVVGFAIIEVIFFSFPTILPVTGSSMNYTSVVIGIMGLFIIANWFLHARTHYTGPAID